MKKSRLILAALISAAATHHLSAADVYWDSNGTDAGAGIDPTGTWGSSLFWGDMTGTAPTLGWTPGDTAIFAAGSDAIGPYTVTLGGNQTAAGVVIEEGAVKLAGGSVLTLGTGPVTIKAGASLSTDSSLRISTTVGSVWTLDGGTAISTNVSNAGSFIDVDSTIFLTALGGGTITHTVLGILNIVNFSTANPVGTTISGPGSLTKTGVGVIAIATTCTYGGPTFINEGELRIRTSVNRLPVTTAVTVNDPGILNLNNVSQQIGSLAGNGLVGLGNATLTVGDATNTAFSGIIRDTANAGASGSLSLGGKVTKVGTGALTLSGVNSYPGVTTISAGTLKVGNASALAFGGRQTTATGTTTVTSGATLDLNGTTGINEPIILNGTGVGGNGALVNSSVTPAVIANGVAGLSTPAIGTGSLYSAPPTIAINGTGSGATATAFLGVTVASFSIDGGTTTYTTAPTVTISGGGGVGASATAILTAGAVTGINITNAGSGFTTAPTLTFGAGTVLVAGANPSVLSTNADHFTVSGMQMIAAGSGYTGTPTFTFDTGNATTVTATLSSVTLAGDSSVGGTGDITINGAVSQSGGARTLTKTGASTLVINGAQSYASLVASQGRTTLNSSLANATITTAAGTQLNLNANATNSAVTVNGSAAFSTSQTLASLTIGAGGIVRLGAPPFSPAPPEAALAPEFGGAVDAVPEPASAGLLLLGALSLLARRR